MIHFETPEPEDENKKWAGWTMRPAKQPRKLTHVASAFVLVASSIVATGLPHQLFS